MCSDFSMTALAVDTMQGLSKCVHSNSFPWYPLQCKASPNVSTVTPSRGIKKIEK